MDQRLRGLLSVMDAPVVVDIHTEPNSQAVLEEGLGYPLAVEAGSDLVRREIGKEQRVKVSNRKGIANQTGPESCVAHREVRDEALTGEPAGQPLSRESNKLIQGRFLVY